MEKKEMFDEKEDRKYITETRTLGGFRYIRRYTKCGKPNCTKCPYHGPYWYARGKRKDGTNYEKYIGKEFKTMREFALEKKMLEMMRKEEEKKGETLPPIEDMIV